MNNSSVFRIAARLLLLLTLSLGLWLLSGRASSTQQSKPTMTQLPVEVSQLDPVGGVVPVELRCADAELSSPRSIEKLTCLIKNNTNKFITASSVEITVNLERNGTVLELRNYYTLEAFLSADFREKGEGNLIPPGGEHPVNELPSSYSDGVVKSIVVRIDYVEFGDNESLGINRRGSQILADLREGASKYKKWLTKKYKENGNSTGAIISLLETKAPPQEAILTTTNQESGADMFRKYLLRDYRVNGAESLARRLNK